MRVLDHEPYLWFLFEENGSLFLDANCNHSAFGYTFMVQLNPGEVVEYQKRGREYLTWLAQEIQNSAPILQVSRSVYKGRDVSAAYVEKTRAAVEGGSVRRCVNRKGGEPSLEDQNAERQLGWREETPP